MQYKDAEVGAGVTLVGPHRDDVRILANQKKGSSPEDVKYFSSRGQQRLVVLELKLSQIKYITERKNEKPLLLLDDIFSELDGENIGHIFDITREQQSIITTTHEDFVPNKMMRDTKIIQLS